MRFPRLSFRRPGPFGGARRFLDPDERVVILVLLHWMKTLLVAVPLLGLFALDLAAVRFGWIGDPGAFSPATFAGALLIVALWALGVARWWSERLVATDQRVIRISGLVWRRAVSHPLPEVGAGRVRYVRGPLGLLLGYGTISLLPPERDMSLRLRLVPFPEKIYIQLLEIIQILPDVTGSSLRDRSHLPEARP